tara:strand:+ start:235 stop:531 length:297 start_codon:yes stop_codon:yes gene_type:complete
VPDNNLQRFSEKKRTEGESNQLRHELTQLQSFKIYDEVLNDAEVELKQCILALVEENKELTNEQLHALRGEAQALYRTWDRLAEFADVLDEEINKPEH